MKAKTTEEFIKEAKLIHGDKYDYSLTNYVNAHSKVKIICPVHGAFEQEANSHKRGNGCPECRNEKLREERALNFDMTLANKIHNNFYDYSLVNYVNIDTPVKIICPKHGIFEMTPYHHINRKQCCSKCRSSHGEQTIRNFLKEKSILFEEQKTFESCKDERTLPFDFYIPEKNLLIEYNGEQHYRNSFYLEYHKWLKYKHHDWLKRKFAKDNKINLLTISYKDYNIIEKILEENLWQK